MPGVQQEPLTSFMEYYTFYTISPEILETSFVRLWTGGSFSARELVPSRSFELIQQQQVPTGPNVEADYQFWKKFFKKR